MEGIASVYGVTIDDHGDSPSTSSSFTTNLKKANNLDLHNKTKTGTFKSKIQTSPELIYTPEFWSEKCATEYIKVSAPYTMHLET